VESLSVLDKGNTSESKIKIGKHRRDKNNWDEEEELGI
jgi:hypothetical protein